MAKAFEVVYLKPEQIEFSRRGDTLGLTVSEDSVSVHYPRVILRPCFPVSDNVAFLSVRDANADRQPEIGIIEDWTQLEPADRDAVAAELSLYYLVPKIQRIDAIKEELGFLYWTVETDKGPQEFVMRNNITQTTRQVTDTHWLVIDVNDARHEIPDISRLDPRSQKLLERYLSV
ncbi:MAG: DUF1854 domain-containing protein [Anaerolineae bacterium]|jgi:hypothetical protein|nr:DUF1854 domain-containing protein [Anaerolineae bacterium]